MATTGIVNGTLLKVYVDATAIAYTTNASLELSMATRDTSNKGSLGWKTGAEGQRSATISGDYLFAFDAAYGFEQLFALMVARTPVAIKMWSGDAADKFISGSAYLTSLSKAAPMEDTVSGSFSFEFTGALTFAT